MTIINITVIIIVIEIEKVKHDISWHYYFS